MKKRECKEACKTEPLKTKCNHNTMSGYGFAVTLFNKYLTLHKTPTMEIFMSTAYVNNGLSLVSMHGPPEVRECLVHIGLPALICWQDKVLGFSCLCHGQCNGA